jgi:hypothetical protein
MAEEANLKYIQIQKEMSERLQDVVSTESLIKDRDERIAALRDDINNL